MLNSSPSCSKSSYMIILDLTQTVVTLAERNSHTQDNNVMCMAQTVQFDLRLTIRLYQSGQMYWDIHFE